MAKVTGISFDGGDIVITIESALADDTNQQFVERIPMPAPIAHTVASHSDTMATGTALDELTSGNDTTLHGHAGSALVVSGATVFGPASSPISWTDLDLSGTTGVNSALVILSISAGTDMDATAVRKNGDTAEYYSAAVEANAYGCALAHHDSTAVLVLTCVTDSSGVIEWITEAQQTATVKLLAYIK